MHVVSARSFLQCTQSENVNISTDDPDEVPDNLPPLVSTPAALNQSQQEQAAQQ